MHFPSILVLELLKAKKKKRKKNEKREREKKGQVFAQARKTQQSYEGTIFKLVFNLFIMNHLNWEWEVSLP